MFDNTIIELGTTQISNLTMLCTANNTVISPDFLVWKFCGKAQFPHSFGRIARNYAETLLFHTRKSGEITVFFAVMVLETRPSSTLPIFEVSMDVYEQSFPNYYFKNSRFIFWVWLVILLSCM